MIKQLVCDFCSQEQGSRLWHKSAYLLLSKLQKLPRLSKNYSSALYLPDFEEIFNDTLLAIAQNVCQEFQSDETDYEKSLVNWINYKLRLHFKTKDVQRQAKHKPLSLDRYINDEEQGTFLEQLPDQITLNTIEQLIEEQQMATVAARSRQIWQYIEQDPDNLLKNCQIAQNNLCNCHYLAQKRYLEEPSLSFKEIAADFVIPMGTLTAHWHRRCKPLLIDIAEKFQ